MNCPQCDGDYFAESCVMQTSKDGRCMTFASDQTNQLGTAWVKHLTCIRCNERFIIADKNRSGGKLISAGSKEAKELLDHDRQDFSKSFDPRQNKEVHVER